ncbi:hypothetical protein VP01_681g4 [Puccinia sorghi]|uniref:Integrase catalytic domain-containing protein n=1 Tax=Puccinia sorghi TaxID=27349 RepID=A0A0L6UEK0_9BASI|nr:hypothetical protein VP01_681g4 [Puccinia sorghi]
MHHTSLYSPSELLHKSLGHVSWIRQRLGIPVKDFSSCEACAVSKITRGSFHTRHSQATKPFEELHMDLVGPISPLSREGHKYFLTIVDSCTRFCSAIPIKHKSEVAGVITQAVGLGAKRIGYHPTILGDDGRIVNTKHLSFLDLPSSKTSSFDDEDLNILNEDVSDQSPEATESDAENPEEVSKSVSEEDESTDDEEVAASLAPNPTCTHCDRTAKVKPEKHQMGSCEHKECDDFE